MSSSESEVAGEDGAGEGRFEREAATEKREREDDDGPDGGGETGTSESEETPGGGGSVGLSWRGFGCFRGFETRGPKATVLLRSTLPLRRVFVCSEEDTISSFIGRKVYSPKLPLAAACQIWRLGGITSSLAGVGGVWTDVVIA